MAFSIAVSATVQTAPPTSGTSATSLRPAGRTFSLTGVLGTAIVKGDVVALWGSNDGGATFQPLRQSNNAPVQLNYYNPEVVIDDACDTYATQRLAVGPGSALAAVGFNGEGVYLNPAPAWVQGGNAGFSPVGILGTTDSNPFRIIAEGIDIFDSDGSSTAIGNTNATVPGNQLFLAAGSGGVGITADGGGSLDITVDSPGTIDCAALAFRIRRSTAGVVVPLELFDATDAAFVGFKAPNAMGVSYVIVLPSALPTVNGQYLSATTAGVASWAGGTVNVQANNTNAQSIADGAAAAAITTWTEVTDSASAFNNATGVFTAPVAGFYQIAAQIEFSAIAAIIAAEFTVQIFKNGAAVAINAAINEVAALNQKRIAKIDLGLQLALNDTIDIRSTQNSGSGANTLTNVAARNILSISRVG